MFDMIDATGSGYKNDPRMRDVEAEMIRSHALCLKISAKKPTDPDYKSLLEELFQSEIDDSVAIVSPFYCDCGCHREECDHQQRGNHSLSGEGGDRGQCADCS